MNNQSVTEFLGSTPTKKQVREFLKDASIETLREFLRSVSASHNYYKYAESELVAKLSEAERKIHWSTWVIFIFTIIGAIAAVAAALFAWKTLNQ